MACPPNDFYVYLSNRNNKNGQAIVTAVLPTRLDMSTKEYEMALVELQAPRHWPNVTNCSFQIINMEDPEKLIRSKIFTIPDDYYKSFQEVFTIATKQTGLAANRIEGVYANLYANFHKDNSNRYRLVLAPGGAVALSNRFQRLLGLAQSSYANDSGEEIRVDLFPDINLDQYSLMAKCNLTAPSFVENRMDQVLRIFSSQRLDKNEMLNLSFNPIYVPIATNLLDVIEIRITDMVGRLIKFSTGEIVILVHLKKRE